MDLRRWPVYSDADLHAERALTLSWYLGLGILTLGMLGGGPRWALAQGGAAPSAAAQPAAQPQVSVEVSPLRVEVQAEPGSRHTQAITVTNVGQQATRVRATLADWYLSKDGAPQFEEPQEGRPYAAATWVRFAPPELVLEPGANGTVRFTIAVPEGIEPAGYRTGLLFEFNAAQDRPTAARARQVLFKSRIATLIYVHIGQPAATVELTDLRVRSDAQRTQVVATLKNSSRRSVRTQGSLVLFDHTGTPVREVQVPDVPVLPESERELAITAFEPETTLPAGDYRVEVKMDVGLRAVLIGETTLKVGR